MARESGVDIGELLAKGKERVVFENYEQLIGQLNDYVGENGKYTSLVKAVVLYANNPQFKELSIVDTPGLNDPVLSRTTRTKEFMEVCDVVFFLTPCSSFLNQSDWTMLSAQLPQKGVKQLVLVGSKFDYGLMDVLQKTDPNDPFGPNPNSADNIPAAIALVRKKLTARAQDKVVDYEKDLINRGSSKEMLRIVTGCRKPLFVSAMARNMTGRSEKSFDDEERIVYNALLPYSIDIAKDIAVIGDFEPVKAVHDSVVNEKEAILMKKSADFLPVAQIELTELLSVFKLKATKELAILSGSSRQDLIAEKEDVNKRVNCIRADIQALVGEWLAKIEDKKQEGIHAMRSVLNKSTKLQERSGTETKTSSREISIAKWYKPWTWFKTKTVYNTYEESYNYLATADAADNIRQFVLESETRIENAFADSISYIELKRRLLAVVAENFDMSDEGYDASLFRLMIEEQIRKIEFPIIKMDCRKEIESITSKFSGQVRGDSDRNALQNALMGAVESAHLALIAQFEQAVSAFKNTLTGISDNLQMDLLKDINEKLDDILKQLDEKDANIARLNAYINRLGDSLKEAAQ